MDLLSRIVACKSVEEVDAIVTEELDKLQNSTSPIEQLGFISHGKSISCYKGFIPFKTRIKYASQNLETYGMESTDFFYEFAYIVNKYKINNAASLVHNLEIFINQYFGIPGKCDRETIFNDNAWNSTTTDEEYFAALENNKLGDLKGKGAAECTERGALAEQILSLFGMEVYYCMGCVDLGDKQEPHCFNIVRRKNDYALLDYSVPIVSYKEDGSFAAYYPFIGSLTEEEFLDFINNGVVKNFDNYIYNGKERELIDSSRKYVVGLYEIEKNKTM